MKTAKVQSTKSAKTPADWLNKFYPESAAKAAKRSWFEALEHSIRKWSGLYPTTLKSHGIEKLGKLLKAPISGQSMCLMRVWGGPALFVLSPGRGTAIGRAGVARSTSRAETWSVMSQKPRSG